MTPVTAPADPRLSRCTVYLKGEPKALGTVQIMIGITTFLFGIVLFMSTLSPAIISGISLWGSLIHISSGALTVAAANNFNSCVIKASLVMNVLSTVAAGIALILFAVDMIFGSAFLPRCPHYGYGGNGYDRYVYDDNSYSSCKYFGLHMWNGIYGVLLVFSVLEFIISICTSSLACKATCTTPTYSQMAYTQSMTVQPVNPQTMTVQSMNTPLMNVQSMNTPLMNVQSMNAQPMTAPAYNPAFYSPPDPQQSYPPPPYNKV